MNAYELADIVDKWAYKESAEYLTDAATLIRQQQAEIEALKSILAEVDRQVFNIELKDDGTMTPVIRMEKP